MIKKATGPGRTRIGLAICFGLGPASRRRHEIQAKLELECTPNT